MKEYGKKIWLIPDCFLDSKSKNASPSHEAICVINTTERGAHMEFTFYYEDRPAVHGYTAECGAEMPHHVRMDKLTNADGVKLPRDTPYATLVESDTPIVVQYSRLDTSEVEMALMTTIAYPVQE